MVDSGYSADPFDISIDPSQFSNDSAKFLGIITIDQIVPGGTITGNDGTSRETGPQWQLGVRPVHFALSGETGAYVTWFSPSTKKNSKISAIVTAMSKLPAVFPKDKKVAKGQLLGTVAWWVRRDIEWGNQISRNVLIPIGEATPEEIEEANESVRGLGAVPAQSLSFNEEETTVLLNFLDGKTLEDAQVAAARSRNLPDNLRQAVLSGDAVTSLTASGAIEMAIDGTITSNVESAA